MDSTTIVLRAIAAAVGVALLVWAIVLVSSGAPGGAAWVLVLDGGLIVAGVIFEKQRYRPKVDTTKGNWTKTDEKFKDPTTGKLMQVLENPQTGERDYIEIG